MTPLNVTYTEDLAVNYALNDQIEFECDSGLNHIPENSTIVCHAGGWNILPACVSGQFISMKIVIGITQKAFEFWN